MMIVSHAVPTKTPSNAAQKDNPSPPEAFPTSKVPQSTSSEINTGKKSQSYPNCNVSLWYSWDGGGILHNGIRFQKPCNGCMLRTLRRPRVDPAFSCQVALR